MGMEVKSNHKFIMGPAGVDRVKSQKYSLVSGLMPAATVTSIKILNKKPSCR